MYIQGVDNVFDLQFNDAGVTYGDVFLENEKQMSKWNFEVADTEALFDLFRKAAAECRELPRRASLPIPAYEQAIKASHIFNTLQARGVISVAERQAYIGRVRDLAKGACGAWMEHRGRPRDAPTSCSNCCPRKSRRGCRRKARNDLARMFAEELGRGRARRTGAIETFSTPRRLALIARDVAAATEAVSEEIEGPAHRRAAAGARRLPAQDRADPRPARGARRRAGSRRSSGRAGRPARCSPKRSRGSSRDFPWPKSMRWGDVGSTVAALGAAAAGIVALLGEEIVPVEIAGDRERRDDASATASTIPGRSPSAARTTMSRNCAPATSSSTRTSARRSIRDGAREAAARRRADAGRGRRAGGRECRADRMAGAAARPVRPGFPRRAARGDRAHHAHQPEIFRLRGRGRRRSRRRSSASPISTRTTAARRSSRATAGCSRRGSRRALLLGAGPQGAARGAGEEADGIVFHEKLGTVADKVERVAKLARWLVEEGIVPERAIPTQAERAARLAKADLVTGMVGEFPELQGVIGGYLAARRASPTPSPTRSATITSRSGRATTCRPRR